MPKFSTDEYPVSKRWLALGTAQQIEEVRDAMKEGHTNVTAAKKLGTTPGAVAGIRHRNNIASSNQRRSAAVQETKKGKPSNAPARKKIVTQMRTGSKSVLAASEANQCQYIDPGSGHRCGYEGSPRCVLHPETKK